MKKAVRIIAELIGSQDIDADPRWKVVFDTVLDGQDKIVPQHYFGYQIVVSGENDAPQKIPFMFLRSDEGVEVFIAESTEPDDANDTTNIYTKTIRAGETFAFVGSEGDWVYQIREVRPLT